MRRVAVLLCCAAGCRFGFDDLTRDARPGIVVPRDLAVEWATPHGVMWSWDWDGDPEMLDHFELVTGASEAQVRARTGTIIGPAQQPQLGMANLPDNGARVVHAIAPVSPGTSQWVALAAVDKLGGISTSAVMRADAPAIPANRIVLYDETIASGAYTIPAELVETTTQPHSGLKALEFDSPCNGDCFENLRIQGLAISVSQVAPTLERAYLEIWVAPALGPSFWTQVRLCLTDCNPPGLRTYDWLTLRADAGYQRVEVPLRALHDSADAPLSAADLTQPVYEWMIGGTWPLGAHVHVDDVSIFY